MNQIQMLSNQLSDSLAGSVLRIGITGGIGSGKSYVCRQLEAAGHRVFYCDDEAKRIIRTDPEVKEELKRLVGEQVYDADGQLVKRVLSSYLCRGRDYAHRVDDIVHPRVAAAFSVAALQMAGQRQGERRTDGFFRCGTNQGTNRVTNTHSVAHPEIKPQPVDVQQLRDLQPGEVIFMECALLFESMFDALVDCSVLVHVSQATQLARLMARDGISEYKAREWMALQLGEEEKMRRADYVLDNE